MLGCSCFAATQEKSVEDFGYRHLKVDFRGDMVDVVVHSRAGEETEKKPVLLFFQGSLAKPVIKYSDGDVFGLLPFSTAIFDDAYHLAIVGKPGIPVVCHLDRLSERKEFVEPATGRPPKRYIERNYLGYYVERADRVVELLRQQPWVADSRFVVAGHSEGSSIAAGLAARNRAISHVIYSGGTPYYSRILAMIAGDRRAEKLGGERAEATFGYWESALAQPFDDSREHGWNSYRGTVAFSVSASADLRRAGVPVLVSYGTRDPACPFNDMFRVEVVRDRVRAIDFKAYVGREHNYFPVRPDGSVDHTQFGWDDVGRDWRRWLDSKD
ncbi:MAG: hypothetical protein NXI31_21015 [bacterium]|nr:hypothetical protein [bacterium]